MICISVARMMMVRSNELSNGIRVVIRLVFQLKQSVIEFLGEAKKLRGDLHDSFKVKSNHPVTQGPLLSQHHPLS